MTEQERYEMQQAKAARRKQMKRRRMILKLCIVVVFIAAGVGIFSALSTDKENDDQGDKPGGLFGGLGQEKEEPVDLTISCVGDIMVHKSQLTAQYDSATKTYSFDDNFQYVKNYIEAADLALCNVETTFAGGTYSGWPAFNAPETLADAIKNAGFDVAITSNNHMMDKGFSGMQRTVEILREADLPVTGSRLKGETQNYVMQDVKGLKVAVIAYTYESPGVNGQRTLNGNPLSDDAKSCVNSFSYHSLDADLEAVKNTIDTAKTDGADIVAVYYHWGEEYQRSPNDWQQSIALKTANMGADMIFASHPHVLQGVEMLKVPQTDATGNSDKQETQTDEGKETEQTPQMKTVPVFYSMGNFISNQRAETLDNRYTEQGMIANVHLTYDKTSKKITDISMDAMPTWVDKYNSGGKVNYAIVPLDSARTENAALKASGHSSRANQALEDVKALLGAEYIQQK